MQGDTIDRSCPDCGARNLAVAQFCARCGSGTRSWPMRLWRATPDWVFRLLGAVFFIGYLAWRADDYFSRFWSLGPWYRFPNGYVLRMPWVRVLVDLTYLLIAVGFCLRLPPRWRAAQAGPIALALLGAFWPFLPFVVEEALGWFDSQRQEAFRTLMWGSAPLSLAVVSTAAVLMLIGNALDLWGYGVLCRSLSIVPEARALKTGGPYRFVRHPVYLGQMIAQAGVWLVLAPTHLLWIAFYLCFVALQLYRSWVEDRVLERAFGEQHRTWRKQTHWFF